MTTGTRLEKFVFLLLVFPMAIAATIAVGCGTRRQDTIVVGSKNFTEQIVLAELFAQQIEAHSSLHVERRVNLGGTLLCHQALVSGKIDLYPEYTGTALTAVLNDPPQSDPSAVFQRVQAAYRTRFDVEVLPPLGFNNTFAMVVRGDDASSLHLRNISDILQYAPKWRAGFGYEFMERPDGYRGWVAAYGLHFSGEPRILDLGLLYRALADHQVDIVAGNSTDGVITALGMVVLRDDRHYFPPYEAVPLVRRAALDKHPEVGASLGQLAGKISDEEMRKMNYAVDGEHRDPAQVVREFSYREGIVNMDSRKLTKLAKTLRGRRIAVAGDFMLDHYVWGSAVRLSPEAPVPVVDFINESQVLGGAGNVAANLAALGATVLPFGVVGNDDAGRAIRACLDGAGIVSKGVVADSTRVTTVKTRVVARQQQIVRMDRERREPLNRALEESLIRRIKAALSRLDALVISDYDKGVISDPLADRVLTECHRRGVPVLVKPKTSRLFAYRGATVIICNAKEAGFFVTRSLEDDESVGQAGSALLAHFGCSAVVITRGAEGLNVFEDTSSDSFHVPATSREISYARIGEAGTHHVEHGRQVFDVTGAGDTVLSVLALAVAARIPVREASVLANAGAGVVVGKLGTSTITPAELFAAVRDLR